MNAIVAKQWLWRNEGDLNWITSNSRGAESLWRPQITAGASKSPSNVYNTAHLLPKDLRFDHGGPKLAFFPGCDLTSLLPTDTASWCARNSCKKRYSNCFYLRVIDYKRSHTSLYSIKSWIRIGTLRQCHWFALKYFLGLYFKYFINLKSLELGGHCPRRPPGYVPGGNRILTAGYRPAQAFVIERSLCAYRLVIQINQPN